MALRERRASCLLTPDNLGFAILPDNEILEEGDGIGLGPEPHISFQ